MKPFLFVVGCSRSGTTLLRAMLDSHPELAVPPESHFLVPLLREPFTIDRFLTLVGEHKRFAKWGVPIEDVARMLAEDYADDLSSSVRALYKTYASAHGKSRWADKTPGYTSAIPGIAGLLPEARFVHIIRDGRDVALSWLETPFGPDTVEKAARNWRKAVRAGRRGGEEVGSDRYIEVRYETLTSEPEIVLRAICDLGELSFERSMLEYPQKAEGIIEQTMRPSSHGALRRPPTKGLRDWRRDMPPEDVRVFQDVAGGLLGDLGYETV